MLYYRCPTCRTILANKQLLFEKGLKDIIENEKMNDKEKDIEKQEILNKLHVKNICCRMRMLTYVRKIEIVK